MKKPVCLLLAVLLFTACASTQSPLPPESTGSDHACTTAAQTDAQTDTFNPVDPASVHYIRTNGYISGAEYPRLTVIDSPEALSRYIAENEDKYSLDSTMDGQVSFRQTALQYDADFFSAHDLLLLLLEEGSGSIRHRIERTDQAPDGGIAITVTRLSPQVQTCDMAEWHICIPLPRGRYTEEKISLIFNNRTIVREGTVKYVRAGGFDMLPEPVVRIFESADALDTYLAENGLNDNPAMQEALAEYRNGFFPWQSLALVLLGEGSGSIRHRLDSVERTIEKDGRSFYNVRIARLLPDGDMTADCAWWHIIFPMPNGVSAEQIRIELTEEALMHP